MPRRHSLAMPKVAVVLLVALPLVLAGFAALHLESLTRSPESYQLDLSGQWEIDPSLLRYDQVAEWPLALGEVRAIAVGPEDCVYVAGDRAVQVFQADARPQRTIELADPPQCLAVGGPDHVAPGRIYVGIGGRMELYGPDGDAAGRWDDLGDGALITAIALAEEDVFAADAGNRVVLRLAPDGRILGRIGDRSAGQGSSGFIIPSPYFDLTASPNRLLHIVNPGARRVETYTFDGKLEIAWGDAGTGLSAFFGCCNPAHLACLPDGRLVTSEKGIPRIKLYSPEGEFQGVVAGPKQLEVSHSAVGDPRDPQDGRVYDIAADSQERVLVLDPAARSVRVFVGKKKPTDREHERS